MKNLSDLSITFIAGLLGPGGAERQLFYILQTLKSEGCNTNLLTLTEGEFWESQIKNLGIPIYYAGKAESRITRLFSIMEFIKSNKPDIIQSQHFYTNIYAALTGYFNNIISIGALRSDGVNEVRSIGSVLGKLSILLPKFVAANSRIGREYALKTGKKVNHVKFLPNVIDTDIFQPVKTRRLKRPVEILLVSNLKLPEKRVDLFIDAVDRLRSRIDIPFSVKIIGDGPLRPLLQNKATDKGLFPGILEFLGNQDNLEKHYQAADIFVLTSEREGTPNVVMEAMSTGLPVIATRVGGIPDLLQDGKSGFLTQSGNVEEIAERMAALCSQPDLRKSFGEFGRDFIIKNHSLINFPTILPDFYGDILR